jgi:predicted ATPase/GAF domain-containing protein
VATSMPSGTEPFGYLLELIREGVDFTLYRGRKLGTASPVLVLALTERPSPQDLRRLEHEYSLAAELDPAWAAKPLAFTRHEGRTILVLTDPGGEPLDLVLERDEGQPLDLTRFLRIAIGLAAALGQVHRQGLIHKDIKPANVLVADSGNVWLTGFGIASRLPRERQAPAPPEIIAGTLAYMAPEQTGRMNRSIDTRSDLYSLGVTLYQMLTGHLPFDAADPLEWVHCHIARQPTPPGSRGAVPDPLSTIVVKLLAKNPEERYQTAAGLEADLRLCLEKWQSHDRIDPFPLGAHDCSDQLLIPEKLYGREREIDALLAAFDRVTHGTPELVLVCGYSGVGKSSLVNELHKAIVPVRGLFAAGKFDQYKRDIPYATLAQAFQTLVRQILVKSEAEVERWRGSLHDAVGPNGQLIINLIPEVEFLIGKQPPVAELPPRDAQNRFQLVFRRFLAAFAQKEHPLALFLDDLQWMDAASLELLEHLVTHSEVRHLLLVGAYRDNEVSLAHPLLRTLETIRGAGARVQEIVLAPLGLDDVGQLLADALHCELECARPLAQLVQEKTEGNPFFAIQFFTALAEEGLLAFDSVARAWQWDMNRIRAKNYTDNVVDFMSRKLMRLSAPTQEVLKALACLGTDAEVATLALAQGETKEAMHVALQEAVRAGLVYQQEGSCKFLHDRIQQAAYNLIPEDRRAEVHLHIGRVLLANMTADELPEHLFEVANQFNRGAALLVDREEKTRVATIELRAGRKAKASTAYASARAYFSAGMALLDESDWGSQHELTFSLWRERAQCEILCGNFAKAEQVILRLLQRGASNIEFANASCLKIDLHALKAEYPQAVDSSLTCLRRFGIDLPAHPNWEQVEAELETVWQALTGRPIESLIDLPLMSDQELRAAMQVLSALVVPAYHTDFQSFCVVACRMVKVNILHGVSGPSTHADATLAIILGPVFHRYDLGYRFAKLACDLIEKHGFIAYKAKVYHAMGVAAFWTQPIAVAIDSMRTTSRTAIETGDLTFAVAGMDNFVKGLLSRNDPLDAVWRESEMVLEFASNAKYGEGADMMVSQQRFIATMQGRTDTFSTFSEAHFDEAAFEAHLTAGANAAAICTYSILKLKARFLSGDYPEALAAANKAKPLRSAAIADFWGQLDFYYYAALTVAALYEKASDDEQTEWRELLAAHREQLREWADNNPPTFGDKHALVSAEIARIEGRAFDAMQLYEQAIQSARENGFVQNEALAHEVAARFYLERGFETIARTYLRSARNCYERWGALGKVKQLDELYPHLHEGHTHASTIATIGTPVGQLDVETVVKASQALSSEMVLSNLIEKLMRIAIEHAGAERGLLILLHGDEARIEAEATTGQSGVEVTVRQAAGTPDDLPQSALHYVIRSGERVVLDDASVSNLYSEDEYVRQKRLRSALCLPIIKQTKLIGALYLENNLTPRAFTADRVAVLELLASQAAISLENATLFSDLQRSEAYLAQGQSISHTGSLGWNVMSGEIYWSEETYHIYEVDRAAKATRDLALQLIHPDDRDRVLQTVDRAISEKANLDFEHRLLMPDGSVKYLHALARALETSSGDLEFVGAVTDVTAAKQAGEALRRSESYLAEAQRLTHTGSGVWSVPGWDPLYLSEEWYRIYGFDPEQGLSAWKDRLQRMHPEDQAKVQDAKDRAVIEKSDYAVDHRIVLPDGTVKYTHTVGHPVLNASGEVEQFVCTMMDVSERTRGEEALRIAFEEIKALRDQLYRENLALKEEVDRASMFEEIVGISPALRAVLSRVAKVAPTDSTVLITGETGTGKELIARAVHKRSQRSSRAFVSVNCAVIPRDLIASELFGHEKGAFTGATQRRLGRFELAEGGTIFLDEIGELPAETQIALLRVLQEHEFERVGGTASIRTDVRVIAATNRDLEAAIATGMFRSDLFYRLNVFPIEVPPLRERREDIPVLVGYFINRYARRAGKNIRGINKKSLELLQSYPWPGNIRELQNVIERSVILCDTENFSVDESWFSRESVSSQPKSQLQLSRKLAAQEKDMIEAALRESGGRVSGPSGAAAKLGMPGSTLYSKIGSLRIDKNRFKGTNPSRDRS